jgi:hypothetical protein
MVVASAVDDDGEELHPAKWKNDVIDLPEFKNQRQPCFTAAEVETIVVQAGARCSSHCWPAPALESRKPSPCRWRMSKALWSAFATVVARPTALAEDRSWQTGKTRIQTSRASCTLCVQNSGWGKSL